MFNKTTTFSISSKDIEILDGDMIKTASEFLFPTGHTYDPDYLYLRVRGISAGEYWGPNKNADYFPEKELIATYKTFLTAHTFKNHENKKAENAIGDVIDASWNDKMKYVDLIIRIDRKLAPQIVRSFEKGIMTDVSMGCKIKHSICSICGNVAQTRAQYCTHILNEKHKVYPDGRRTYEINISPNFHDISAVLNGADRTAKAVGIHIVGSKVAFVGGDFEMQKVANYEDDSDVTPDNNYKYGTLEQALSKIAAAEIEIDGPEEYNILSKHASVEKEAGDSIARMKKVAEIAKEIQGKITSLVKAKSDIDENTLDSVAQKIKLYHTKYMDQEKCMKIANGIKNIAVKNDVPVEQTFDDFIKLLNITGVELSPLELDRILRYTNDIAPDESDLDSLVDNLDPSNFEGIKDMSDMIVDKNTENNDCNMPTMFNIFKSLAGRQMPTKNVHIVIRKITPINGISRPSVETPYSESDVFDMIRPIIESRSSLRPFLTPRLLKRAMSEDNETIDAKENMKNFILPVLSKMENIDDSTLSKYALSSYEYSAYQNNRSTHYLNEESFNEINKYSYSMGLEKEAGIISDTFRKIKRVIKPASTATEHIEDFKAPKGSFWLGKGITNRKALLFGIPAAALYSKYQQSRINQGQRVSSLNAFAAENPEAVIGSLAALTPFVVGRAKYTGGKINALKNIMKKTASGTHILFDKSSKELYTDNMLEDSIDIFKNASIDKEMSIEYNGNQVDAIKLATVLKCMNREDLAEEKMASYEISNSDIEKYLLICEKHIKIEIDKQASELEEKVASILKSSNFSNSALEKVVASIPPSDIDSLLISKIK